MSVFFQSGAVADLLGNNKYFLKGLSKSFILRIKSNLVTCKPCMVDKACLKADSVVLVVATCQWSKVVKI